MEKNARLNNQSLESSKILLEIASLLYTNREYNTLFSEIKNLTKKRGQSKKAIISLVHQCMTYIDTLSNLNFKLELIKTIKEVSDKKIYLEVEYARCCFMMVKW